MTHNGSLKDNYITLMKCRELDLVKHQHFLDSFIQLKDYNTDLRIAISNIPEKNKNSQAIKKAKRLANKEPTLYKRQQQQQPQQPQRVKRAYTRRKLTASSSKRIDSSSLDDDDDDDDDDTTTTTDSSDSSDMEGSSSSCGVDSSGDDDVPAETKPATTVDDCFGPLPDKK